MPLPGPGVLFHAPLGVKQMRTSAPGVTPVYKWYAIVASGVNNYTAANAAGNLAREFALRDITSKVPAYAKGKHQPTIEPASASPR